MVSIAEARQILGEQFEQLPDSRIEELLLLFNRLSDYCISEYIDEKINKKSLDVIENVS